MRSKGVFATASSRSIAVLSTCARMNSRSVLCAHAAVQLCQAGWRQWSNFIYAELHIFPRGFTRPHLAWRVVQRQIYILLTHYVPARSSAQRAD